MVNIEVFLDRIMSSDEGGFSRYDIAIYMLVYGINSDSQVCVYCHWRYNRRYIHNNCERCGMEYI